MKKTLMAVSIAAIVTTPTLASADTILGFYAGANQWQASFSGDIGSALEPTSIDEMNFEDETNTVLWAKLEHPVPIIPNIMLVNTAIKTQSSALFEEPIDIGGLPELSGLVTTDLDLTHTDATLYYEILDNWISLDLGLTARMFSGHFNVVGEVEDVTTSKDNAISATIPLLYASIQFDLPLTGFQAGANGNIISYQGDKILDASLWIGYTTGVIPLFDVGFNAGYRSLSLTIEEVEDVYIDAKMDGAFFEISAHF